MKGEVRRSQLITTYGVGAIIAVEDESFMVAGIDRWPVRRADLHEERLERLLGVTGFALPPASERDQDIPVVRFPKWVWCPTCRRLAEHRHFCSSGKNECGLCKTALVPSRFVVCCSNGHISDFPYFRWVHTGSKGRTDRHELRMETGGTTASLRDIKITCTCGAERTMEHAFSRDALRGIARCDGERPWLGSKDPVECDQTPRTLQRGASNVWFSVTHSAISIPPWSEGAFKILNRQWLALQHVPDGALEPTIRGMRLADGTTYTVEQLVEAVRLRKAEAGRTDLPIGERLKEQEYEALCTGRAEASKDQDFVCVPPERVTTFVRNWFDQVMLVKRLREVRVLRGFSRVTPPGPLNEAPPAPLYESNPGWLPAMEVLGEGVFLRLSESQLKEWEERAIVRARAARINANYRRRFESRQQEPDRVISARLVLIHSLAHALINQWSLDCGYPAASLRERLYVNENMAGLMIYTATTDSAGSLGGVIAQAHGDRLEAAIRSAIATATWCSADPLCIEADGAGVDSLNLAACHACSLLPEVSCEEMNVMLDRAMLVGVPGQPEIGFFNGVDCVRR